MKIQPVIVKDVKSKVYFVFIKQFPGICTQANTIEEAEIKINKYWQEYIRRWKKEQIGMDESHIVMA